MRSGVAWRLAGVSAVLAMAGACSSGGADKLLVLDGSKVCEVFTPEQILEYGVGTVSAQVKNSGPENAFSSCVWKSAGPSGTRLLTVSFDNKQLNDWVGDKNRTEPVSGYRASLASDIMSIASGPDIGVLTIDSRDAAKPIRDIAEAAVARLMKK
ncbi:hypothetical protein GCM10022247_54970 [Allokutzneria multivorans]|uniref:DUF3558 domain-containing protein n=1 Tax=Allokutzneria multivorans TaxID=1142134 RepID=A0ABP7TBE4_9PSEU